MSKGYWIVSITITDETAYKTYFAANAPIFDKWQGRFIVRGGTFEFMAGTDGQRQVVIEFDSYQQALACYNSPEYQAILPFLRAGSTIAHFIIVEGA